MNVFKYPVRVCVICKILRNCVQYMRIVEEPK
jgi:hypothetical protein